MNSLTQNIHYRVATTNGLNVFYREAGVPKAPAILLLHGFPSSSHMFRDLIPQLADRYHLVAPDLPGFGFSDSLDRKDFKYTFDNLSEVIDGFTETVGLKRYAVVLRKYRLMFAPKHRTKPGPKGPTGDLIRAVLEMKKRNPTWGCPQIADQINLASFRKRC
jgi:hypothetical protein